MSKADETIHTTGGFQRITVGQPAVKLRLAGLGLTAAIASLLILWISHTTWRRVERLQGQFAELKADRFYLGVRMRSDIQRMNDTLLRYRLRGERADYDLYYTHANDLTRWLNTRSNSAVSYLEREFFNNMVVAYGAHLQESTNALEASLSWFQTKAGAFPGSYEKVRQQSQQLLNLCDAFIEEQRSAFDQFLAESNSTLTTFKHLLRLSAVLMLILAAALVAMVYRGMIAPLRHQLTASQAIIARQEKLAALGVLAAGVAHEIRNPLTAIKFRLFSLKKALPAAEAENEDAAMIGNEISRLERIVQDFLRFARPSEPELVTIPAQRLLQEVCDLLMPQLEKSGITLKVFPGETAWLRADPAQIKQVLINLVQNAAESISAHGVITLHIRLEGRRDNLVTLNVTDDGKGIPPEVQMRLFDPFFTTKEGGTGLGLPIAARIVEKHGGELRYRTELNRGTTFSVVLPRVTENET
jgi:signal transduction histidine kinase